jgi:colicin import membrane protein
MEGDLANLQQEAKELAERQAEWNERVRSADSASAAANERRLAAATDSLAAALERMSAEAAQAKDAAGERLGQLGDRAKQAAQQMRQASRSAQSGQRQQAQQQGRQAEGTLAPLDDQIQQASQEMAERWRDEVMEALEQTLAETSRLAERQLAIQEQLRSGTPPQQLRSDQAAVSEGVQRLMDQVQGTQGKNALVPQQIGQALAQAQRQMQRGMESMSSAGGTTREAADRAGDAVDALNAASYQMMRAQGDVSGSQSGSGMAEAMEKMSQLAQQQGGLSKQAGGMLPVPGAGPAMGEMQMLAQRQRAVAAQLERIRAEGQISGAGAMADEARELARRLEAGRLDRGTVERQERLFRRMLDAGRTLQGEEEDDKKERESTTATEGEVRLPPALRARLENDEGRPRPPTWEELQALSPEERRLVLDYFRRLTEAAR